MEVQAVFELEENRANPDLARALEEWGIPLGEDGLLVMERERGPAAAAAAGLTAGPFRFLPWPIGSALMDIHGQHLHQSLLSPPANGNCWTISVDKPLKRRPQRWPPFMSEEKRFARPFRK